MKGRNDLVHLMQAYFQKFGDKACCFEDLRPYLELDSDGLARWTDFLDTIPHEFASTTSSSLWIPHAQVI